MLPSFDLFGFSLPTYSVCVAIGILMALLLALFRNKSPRFQTSNTDIFYTIIFCVIGALIGAKVLHITGVIIRDGHTSDFWTVQNWSNVLKGVGIFYGGLIGGLLAALFYIKKFKLNFSEVTDILIPSVLVAHTFGRIGCFFAGCCYGIKENWGIAFFHSQIAPNDIPLIPIQLFEAGFNVILLIAILSLRPENKRPGILLPLYLLCYSVARFILEFWRGDIGRGIFILSTSQWISLVIFPVAVLLFFSKINQEHKTLFLQKP
ncbi:MAG: prolipoprotein diacylglyceryl transferase [Oscillospiraceae bacterium]|jgi:phosphatidylglycerol:prolipoprotein diacylglycerol transferase|nr:prolipoprotein diacylglyceryl transferase [Oscillospiraceae bacterium]